MEFNIKDIQTKRLTASGLITGRPAWLFSIIGTDYNSVYSVIAIYNGRSTSGNIILDLSGSQYGSDIIIFNMPVFFPDGIYCEFVTNGYSVFSQLIPLY